MRSGDFKASYSEDMRILETGFIKVCIGLFIVSLIAFVMIADKYFVYLINLAAIATIGSLGLNLLTGFTGQISIGHAGFLAIGAYSSAILTSKCGFPFLLALPAAGAITTFAGLLVGIPSLRLKGLYLAITTFAFGFIVEHVANTWDSLTEGSQGMVVPPVEILGQSFDTDRSFFFIVFPITAFAIIFARNLIRSKPGRAWIAIRDQDIAAQTIGINLLWYKLSSFAVSSFYAGIAGALFAHYLMYISPGHFELLVSVQYLAMIIVGGLGSILGSVFGAVFMILLPEVLKFLPDLLRGSCPVIIERFADINLILYGLIIILFILKEPKGLYGIWTDIKVYWRNWPYTY
jgi:branched-chain amino acid transport system permease protein